jgi:hypothetical protein
MSTRAQPMRRRRRRSHIGRSIRRTFRRRWADMVVTIVFVLACVVALLLLLDVIDRTIEKPDRSTVTVPSRR